MLLNWRLWPYAPDGMHIDELGRVRDGLRKAKIGPGPKCHTTRRRHRLKELLDEVEAEWYHRHRV